mmetsp:Transcript_878/g.1758  ORF Transcript_878/g.1758 Transcript_878/m.1758 type:complete len:294 (-) Transcript_878:11-892(-)
MLAAGEVVHGVRALELCQSLPQSRQLLRGHAELSQFRVHPSQRLCAQLTAAAGLHVAPRVRCALYWPLFVKVPLQQRIHLQSRHERVGGQQVLVPPVCAEVLRVERLGDLRGGQRADVCRQRSVESSQECVSAGSAQRELQLHRAALGHCVHAAVRAPRAAEADLVQVAEVGFRQPAREQQRLLELPLHGTSTWVDLQALVGSAQVAEAQRVLALERVCRHLSVLVFITGRDLLKGEAAFVPLLAFIGTRPRLPVLLLLLLLLHLGESEILHRSRELLFASAKGARLMRQRAI